MNIIWLLHWLIPLSIFLLPLLPNKILINVFWYPIIYIMIWIYFDGCPLNWLTTKDEYNKDVNNFSKPIIESIINRKITQHQNDCFLCFICAFIIVISSFKLLRSCKIK